MPLNTLHYLIRQPLMIPVGDLSGCRNIKGLRLTAEDIKRKRGNGVISLMLEKKT